MRRDVLEAAKELILANRDRVNLDATLVVDGREYPTACDQLGNLTSMRSSEAGLAAWICFAAAEDYGFEECVGWEHSAVRAAALTKDAIKLLFGGGDSYPDDHVKEALRRLNAALALTGDCPSMDELELVRGRIYEAQHEVRAVEKMAERTAFSVPYQGQDAYAWISDAEACLAKAATAIRAERDALKARAAS